MCLLLITLLAGPRGAMLVWYLVDVDRWKSAFDTAVVPVLGFLFFPWTILMFVLVAPTGDPQGIEWAVVALGVLLDLMSGGFLGIGRRLFRS